MLDLPVQVYDSLEQILTGRKKPEEASYLIAVSGGMDSMVLLHCFICLGFRIGVAHFNFKLRGESSERDEELIQNYCHLHQIPFHTRSENTKETARRLKLSIQETARELRYSFFEEIRLGYEYDFICTAHHGNDQLETFFIHLFRGSGLKGLTGIPRERDRIIRPMLSIPQWHISQYAEEQSIAFREDESNANDDYLRNRIRHHMTGPMFRENPKYLINALHSISHLNEHQSYINSELADFKSIYVSPILPSIEVIDLNVNNLEKQSYLYLLKLYLLSRKIHLSSIQDFLSRKNRWITGSQYQGDTTSAFYDRDRLWIVDNSFYEGWEKDDSIEISYGINTTLPGGDTIEWIPASTELLSDEHWSIRIAPDKIIFPLIARHRRPGDALDLGAPPYFRKSLKKLLVEHRIPRPLKDRLYLITDGNGDIISVPGIANNSRYSIPTNENTLEIRFKGAINLKNFR